MPAKSKALKAGTVDAPALPAGPSTSAEPPAAKSSVLEKSRGKADAARDSAHEARTEAERRSLALVAHEARVRARERAIVQTRKQLAEYEAALTKLRGERPALEKKLKSARKAAAKADKRAAKRESRYDDAVLKHVVEREKNVDRALHSV